MKRRTNSVLFAALAVCLCMTAAAAQPPGSLLEADGCEVMNLVEEISNQGDAAGVWLVQSSHTGETYTYSFEGAYVVLAFAPDGSTGDLTGYVSWTIDELGAKGTNRTVTTFDSRGYPWPFTFNGQIIRGTRFPNGGIGGTGIYDPATAAVTFTTATLVFCQGHR